MILITLISCRLIDYGTITTKQELSIFDKELEWYEDRFNSLNKELYGE